MSTIKANTLLHSDGSSTTQPSIPALDTRFAKAWVNWDGSGTVAIKASYNVSSITDQTTGDYIVNFATSMASAYYSATGMARTNALAGTILEQRTNVAPTSSSLRVSTRSVTDLSSVDAQWISVTVFSS